MLVVGALPCSCAGVPAPDLQARTDLAPEGRLRAPIDFGNPVLAQKDAATRDARDPAHAR